MSKAGIPEPDPSQIGNIAKPPFVRLPDPLQLFVNRAQRLRILASGHDLAPYLRFLADLSEVQYRIQDGLLEPELPGAEILARAKEHNMPPLDRNRFTADVALDTTIDRLFALTADIDMPDSAREALVRARGADGSARAEMVRSVLADSIPVEAFADHIYVAAALQVHFARLAARLDAGALVAVGDGACPACGSPPTSSLIVGWPNAEGTRFCSCSLCSTLWNYVRVKCAACGSTKDISYQEIEGGNSNVKAETCGVCHTFVKILNQQKDPSLDPVADDVASLGLDLLLRESGYRRGAVNPFLLGY
jgi:FdhE protein